jgi:biopolymer transport protein TolQ
LRIALSQRRTADVPEARLRTLGSPVLALLLQAEGGASAEGSTRSLVELLAASSPVAKVVLLTLTLLSVASWGVILYKAFVFRRTARQSASFLDVFRRSNKFSEVQAVCRSLGESPLVGLFQAGYAELTAQLRQTAPDQSNGPVPTVSPKAAGPRLKSITAVDRALTRASVVEVDKLERRVPFLATTASIAPFIGLFGTVWGIMEAFLGLGGAGGSNSIDAVAPGIAEALINTAAGLAAAIPAVIAYNYFSNRVKRFASEMDDFAMEFLNISERNFT